MFITDNYMPSEYTRNRGPGVLPGDLFTPSRIRHQSTRSNTRVRDYSV